MLFVLSSLVFSCPLCHSNSTELWHIQTHKPLIGREYHRCKVCDLIFVPSIFHWDKPAEIAIYQQHENNPNDLGYRKFLDRIKQPMLQQLALLKKSQKITNKPQAKITGLDFGCGPGPTLSLMFAEVRVSCANYDLYFANHPELLEQKYDFIVSTEVFEHLAQPADVMNQLVSCLKPEGILGIMTQRPRDLAAFQNWRYLADPTHISFFSEACFKWLAKHWQLEQVYLGSDVVLLKKTAGK
mgnify:CR=1 FL=1